MKILVCLKQILDPEAPPRDFRIDAEQLQAARGSANLVTNIFCENALETALQLRDAVGGEITVLSFGPESAEDVLRKALALKADAACLIVNEGPAHPASSTTARVLAAGIRKLEKVDLILVGREAGDWGAGQTGGLLAEELKLPAVSFVDGITADDTGVTLSRQSDTGSETIWARTPLVVTITNSDTNVPRIPKTRDIMKSSKKPITRWSTTDLELAENDFTATTEVVELFIPEKQVHCEFVEGNTIEEKVEAFARQIADSLQS